MTAPLGQPCPMCGRPGADPAGPERRLSPFCSLRCSQVDLGRWLTEQYAVPAARDEVDPAETLG